MSKPKAAGFRPLKTERLTLRPLRAQDAEALHRLVNDWEVTRTLAEIPYPYPRDLADEWIASTAAQLADGTGYHLAITGMEEKKKRWSGSSACASMPLAERAAWVIGSAAPIGATA